MRHVIIMFRIIICVGLTILMTNFGFGLSRNTRTASLNAIPYVCGILKTFVEN